MKPYKQLHWFYQALIIVSFALFICGDKVYGQICPDCTSLEVTTLREIDSNYLGISGRNPSVPSTYDLIGSRKFSGYLPPIIDEIVNGVIGLNWYPVRTRKQIFSGTLDDFGVANYGDESDWNIHLSPTAQFENFIEEAKPFASTFSDLGIDLPPDVSPDDPIGWRRGANGAYTVECEITPASQRYGNPWFTNHENTTSLLTGTKMCVYGPFVTEEIHNNKPEIHPSEQIWWKKNDSSTIVLLLSDGSNRFDDLSDYNRGIPLIYNPNNAKPWTQTKNQEAELSIPFEVDLNKGSLRYEISVLDDFNFYTETPQKDSMSGTKYTATWCNTPILTVEESSTHDKFIGVTFRNICYNRVKEMVQGYIVLRTAIGKGNGKEGFVALQIDKRHRGKNEKEGIWIRDINDNWSVHDSLYDNKLSFNTDVISSDFSGKGIVDGFIDFNGNGKTDLFAMKDNKWLVLYDGKGTWQEINTSSESILDLRFGDINRDNITDILYANSNKKVLVSYGGTQSWQILTDAGAQTNDFRVGDFNGDNKTDIVYMKFIMFNQYTFKYIFNMYVKYSGTGSWQKLNFGYNLSSRFEDYENNFRFGSFNEDNKTDIFRYYDKKFVVYWSGKGSYEVINTQLAPNLQTEDLLFANNLLFAGYTDVLTVNRATNDWRVYYNGRPPVRNFSMEEYNDPIKVRFGNFDSDQFWEAITLADVTHPGLPPDVVAFSPVARIINEPAVMARYEEGSIKRISKNGKAALSMNMYLMYYPGSIKARRKKDDYRNVSLIKEKIGSQALSYKPEEKLIDSIQTLGKIEGVPLTSIMENELKIKFARINDTADFNLPGYSIDGLPSLLSEQIRNAGNWRAWNKYLSGITKPEYSPLLKFAPGSLEFVDKIQFEVLPFYSSFEKGKVSLVEMTDAMKELNSIAYGADQLKIEEIFGNQKPFTVKWDFKITNLTTGNNVSIGNLDSVISNGKWPGNKISYQFQRKQDLIEFKALATIIDVLENKTLKPVEFIFFNQRIKFTNHQLEIDNWLKELNLKGTKEYDFLSAKANRMAIDSFLTVAEIRILLKQKNTKQLISSANTITSFFRKPNGD